MPKMFGQLLLYSFERARKALEESGDDACVEPPVPIPNTAVKHARAEGTWLETAWENRSLPVTDLSEKRTRRAKPMGKQVACENVPGAKCDWSTLIAIP